MNAGGVLLAAAGEVEQVPGRWSVQPSLAIFALVLVLLAGFYLGRISDDVHRWWLNLWAEIGRWSVYVFCAAGVIAVGYFLITWYAKHKGAG